MLRADFNGLFFPLLCLSHTDTAVDEHGREVPLASGMTAVAFEADEEDGVPCFLVASGEIEPTPATFGHSGSKWVLRIDDKGVRHVVRLADA